MQFESHILEAVNNGITQAQENYFKGSRSLICWAHEYLTTVNIYNTLLELPSIDDTLGLEEKASDVEYYRRERRGKKPAYVCGNSRCDIVLWHDNEDSPRVVIEVKRWAEDCVSDVQRLDYFLKKIDRVEFCIMASFIAFPVKNDKKKSRELLAGKVKDIEYKIRNILSETNFISLVSSLSNLFYEEVPKYDNNQYVGDEEWVWCPVIFKLSRK